VATEVELERVSLSSVEDEDEEDEEEDEEDEEDEEEEEEFDVVAVDGPDIVPRPIVVPVTEVTAGATVTVFSGIKVAQFFSNSKNFLKSSS